jgi:hypothetical protein
MRWLPSDEFNLSDISIPDVRARKVSLVSYDDKMQRSGIV